MLSNQLLTGQESSRVLVSEDAGNILQVAVNRLFGGLKMKQANNIFARQNRSTASPLGSTIVESSGVHHLQFVAIIYFCFLTINLVALSLNSETIQLNLNTETA
jgi:hypothetical protein